MMLERTYAILFQNHLDPPFENVSGAKERKLAYAARRANQRDAALGYFDDALGVGLSLNSRADYLIIAGHLSLHGQLPAGVARQRVEEEGGAENGLKEIDVMVSPLNMRQFVPQHRISFSRRCPAGYVGGQKNHRAQHAEKDRRADFIRKRQAYFPGSQFLAIAILAIEIDQGSEARVGSQAT